jgi:hypothetical protein
MLVAVGVALHRGRLPIATKAAEAVLAASTCAVVRTCHRSWELVRAHCSVCSVQDLLLVVKIRWARPDSSHSRRNRLRAQLLRDAHPAIGTMKVTIMSRVNINCLPVGALQPHPCTPALLLHLLTQQQACKMRHEAMQQLFVVRQKQQARISAQGTGRKRKLPAQEQLRTCSRHRWCASLSCPGKALELHPSCSIGFRLSFLMPGSKPPVDAGVKATCGVP